MPDLTRMRGIRTRTSPQLSQHTTTYSSTTSLQHQCPNPTLTWHQSLAYREVLTRSKSFLKPQCTLKMLNCPTVSLARINSKWINYKSRNRISSHWLTNRKPLEPQQLRPSGSQDGRSSISTFLTRIRRTWRRISIGAANLTSARWDRCRFRVHTTIQESEIWRGCICNVILATRRQIQPKCMYHLADRGMRSSSISMWTPSKTSTLTTRRIARYTATAFMPMLPRTLV
jgi:hypothetical protein